MTHLMVMLLVKLKLSTIPKPYTHLNVPVGITRKIILHGSLVYPSLIRKSSSLSCWTR